MISPDSIDGLNLWFDAGDISTINDGRVTNNATVYKFVDKISGVALRNNSGVLGPSYSFGAVEGKNAISFTYYNTPNDRTIKGLTASGVTQLDTSTYSMFVVYKPTTKQFQDANGNYGFVVSIWDGPMTQFIGAATNPPASWGNRHWATGDGGTDTTPEGRQNPNGLWIEGTVTNNPRQAVPPSDPGLGYLTNYWVEEIYSRSLEEKIGLTGPSVNKTTIGSARVRNNFRKIGFMKQNSQNLEDTIIPVTINTMNPNGVNRFGPPQPPAPTLYTTNINYYKSRFSNNGDGNKLSYMPRSGGNGTYLVIGSFGTRPNVFANRSYPFEGYFCELLHYNRFLNDEEVNAIREYLKMKWFPTRRFVYQQTTGAVPVIIAFRLISSKLSSAPYRLGDPLAGSFDGTLAGSIFWGMTSSISAANVSEIGIVKSTTVDSPTFGDDLSPVRIFGVDQPFYETSSIVRLNADILPSNQPYNLRVYSKSSYDRFAYGSVVKFPIPGITVVTFTYQKLATNPAVFTLHMTCNIQIPAGFVVVRKGYTYKNIGIAADQGEFNSDQDPYFNGVGTTIPAVDVIVTPNDNSSWVSFPATSTTLPDQRYKGRAWVELSVDGQTVRFWSKTWSSRG